MHTQDQYNVLKWRTKDDPTEFEFFVKPHTTISASSDGTTSKKPLGRTLLVLNVPPFLTRVNLIHAFKSFGTIKDVMLQDHPSSQPPAKQDPLFSTPKSVIKGYQVAYIVFREDTSVKEIMGIKAGDIAPILIKKITAGLPLWIEEYNARIVNTDVLEQNCKDFLQNFEKEEIARKQAEEEETVDDDGWVTVSRKGKGKRAGAIHSEKMEERLKVKKKRFEKQLVNFTPTQIKETRARQLDDLKKKFDEDRQRIVVLRQQRKFRPF